MTMSCADLGLAALDEVFDGIVLLDQHGTEIFQNKSAKAIFSTGHQGTTPLCSKKLTFFELGRNTTPIEKDDFLARLAQKKTLPSFVSLKGRENEDSKQTKIFVVAKEIQLAGYDEIFIMLNIQNEAAERKKVENLNRDNQRMITDCSAKIDFLTNMSHEIRTPLGAILGFADLLENDEIEIESKREYCEIIRRNGLILNNLVNDLLDLSKIISGNFELKPKKIDLLETFADPLCLLQSKAWAKGIQFTANYVGYLPSEVYADSLRISQLILNVVGNAIKFTEIGSVTAMIYGQIIENNRVKISIAVSDSGSGIAPHHQEKLFKPFSQADCSLSRREGGSGLGLSLSMQIAQTMDGEIKLVRSQPDKGSLFEVNFYLDIETPGKTVKLTNLLFNRSHGTIFDRRQLHGISILLAEDGCDNRLLFETILTKSGASVEVVPDGHLAIEALKKKTFDLVIMDLQMPVMTGYEAIAEIRKTNEELSVLALSAHAFQIEKAKCMEEGFSDYLSKPVTSLDLCNKVITMTGRSNQAFVENSILADPDIHQIFIEFQKKVPKKIMEIESEIKCCNFVQVKTLAHTLRGTLGGFEQLELSDLMGRIEDLAVQCSKGSNKISEISKAVNCFKSRYYGSP